MNKRKKDISMQWEWCILGTIKKLAKLQLDVLGRELTEREREPTRRLADRHTGIVET